MPNKTITVLGVHGLGDHRNSTWEETWADAIRRAFPAVDGLDIDCRFVTYDDIFEETEISFEESVSALWKLTKSGVGAIGRRQKGVVGDISKKIRWTAGYVVAWVEDEEFQRQSRKRILDAVKEHKPDIVLAHSLGSLITYNAFSHPDAAKAPLSSILKDADYITIGSQIGNPFVVRNLTLGRIEPLNVRFWHHLYNKQDEVFTAPISIPVASNFEQTDTYFDIAGIADHSAEEYITHRNAIESVWRPISERAINKKAFGPASLRLAMPAKAPKEKSRRALLVGINDYPNEQDRLEGCVNDVYLMSSVLQECGFSPDSIRTCLNGRATTEGILQRLEWLLDEPRAGDERVFYFSGHGARIPEYGDDYEPDRHLESLVPWDFDWSPEKSITDDQIYKLYSQLPYDMHVVMIFDCCHSGGIHRDGSAKAKGITPPDDIRHRELKWDRTTQMWVSRDFERLDTGFSRSTTVKEEYFGNDGATARLGRASMLRGLTNAEYEKAKKKSGKKIVGPYLPLIVQACQEEEYAYEYRHGVTSYGAFTYSFSSILRREKDITFKKLADLTREQLQELKYDQEPQLLGPEKIMQSKVPWI
jgi:hypothetical protein